MTRNRRPQEEYHATRISRNCARLAALALFAGLALGGGGCSLTMHIASLQVDEETTGSIPKQISPISSVLDEEDWRRAQAALNLAVDPQGSGLPVNWDNPSSKNRGVFVQTGQITLTDSTVCRPFSAVVIGREQGESRHEGKACRVGPGEWAIQHITPVGTATAKAKTVDQAMPPKSGPLLLSNEKR